METDQRAEPEAQARRSAWAARLAERARASTYRAAVATDLHGSPALLGTFWAVFGVGAVIGELSAPFLRRLRVWPTMTWIVIGWGLGLLPLGLHTPLWVALTAFFAAAVIWGPSHPPGQEGCGRLIAGRSSGALHVPRLASPCGGMDGRELHSEPRSPVQRASSTRPQNERHEQRTP